MAYIGTTSVGQIGLDLVVNQKQFNKQLTGIQSLAAKVGKTLVAAFSVKQIVDFGAECINLGSDLEEVQNVVDVTFPSMSAKVDEFAKKAASSFGLSETMAKKYSGTLGSMAKAFGFTETEAYEMGAALTGLAGDVASFYNISQDEAYTKLKSVFTGETESLKELGVVMTQSALDAYALANGYGKTTSAMSEAEKVALRYAFVQNQLSAAQGDFSRTSNSWANQVKVLNLQFESLKATIGQGLISAFTPAVKLVNTLLQKVQVLATSFKNLMEGIFGVQSTEISALSSAAESAAAASSSTADSTGTTADNLKKANRFLVGFDVINKASSPTDDSSGSGAGGGISTSGTISSDALGSEKDIPSSVFSKKFEAISNSLDKFKESVSKLSNTIKGGLSWAYENILIPLADWTITEAAPRVIDIFSNAIDIFNAVLTAFQPIWEWFWDNFLEPIAAYTGEVFVTALDGISTALSEIGTWMEENQDTVTTMETAVLGFIAAWKLTELFAFIQMSGGIAGAFKTIASAIYGVTAAKLVDKAETLYLTALYAKDFVVSLGQSTVALARQAAQFVATTAAKVADAAATTAMTVATGIWNGVCAIATTVTTAFGAAVSFLTSPIGLVIIAITALIAAGVLLYKNWDTVKAFALETWQKIQDGISLAVTNIKSVFGTIVNWFKEKYQGIKNVFSSVSTWFADKFTSAYNAVTKPFQAIGNFFSSVYDNIKGKFKAIGTMAGDAIGNSFKSVINGVLATVENTINKAINFINSAISVINDIPGVDIGKVKTVALPRLANGGFVKANTPQLAVIGDNRHQGEVVAPEDKLQEMAMQAVKAAGTGNGITKEELKSIVDNAVLRIVAALYELGFNVDGEQMAKAEKMIKQGIDRRYNIAEIV